MAKQTISFNKNYSDPIEVTSSNLVVRIEFLKPGGVVLERSISGDKFVTEEVINPVFRKLQIIKTGISGCVPGQFLRLHFVQSEPSLITVLQ